MLRKEGQTLEGLIKQVRHDLAARYLAQSRQDLTQIAHNLGFAGLSSFSRWFSGEFGVTPSAWRKQRMAPPAADETERALDPSSA